MLFNMAMIQKKERKIKNKWTFHKTRKMKLVDENLSLKIPNKYFGYRFQNLFKKYTKSRIYFYIHFVLYFILYYNYYFQFVIFFI